MNTPSSALSAPGAPDTVMGQVASTLLERLKVQDRPLGETERALLAEMMVYVLHSEQRLHSLTDQMANQQQVARHDLDTALPNRAALADAFTRAAAAAARYDQPGLLLVVEWADWEAWTKGRGAREIAATLQRGFDALHSAVRSCDMIALAGPGRFAALLERCPSTMAEAKATMIAATLRKSGPGLVTYTGAVRFNGPATFDRLLDIAVERCHHARLTDWTN